MSPFDMAGHASFALSACAWLMRDIVKLRLFALASLMLGLLYNSTLESGPLWLVLFWLSVFLCINLFRVGREIVERLEVRLPADLKAIAAETFPLMHTRDFQRLATAAERVEYVEGDVLLNVGDSTEHVCLLVRGRTAELRPDRSEPIRRGAGVLWGELTFVIGPSQFDASPCRIVVTSQRAVVWRWRNDDLRQLLVGHERLHAALSDAFVRSAGFKHGLLATDENHCEAAPHGLRSLAAA